jgi:hypothetical protein
MTDNSAALAAIQTEFTRFLVDSKMKPETITDYDRMLFQAAFVYGANWAISNALEKAKEGTS